MKININEIKGMNIPTVIDYMVSIKKIGLFDIIENQDGLTEIIFQSVLPFSNLLTEEINILCDKNNKVIKMYHWKATDL